MPQTVLFVDDDLSVLSALMRRMRKESFTLRTSTSAEEARVRVRGNRRTAMDEAKKIEKAGELTEDQLRDLEGDIQKLTDRFVKSIDDHIERKEAEVMKV